MHCAESNVDFMNNSMYKNLYTLSIAAVGNRISRLSDVFVLELPKRVITDVYNYVYNYRDPRKYYNYQPLFFDGIDDLAEAALAEFDCFDFSTQFASLPAYTFQFLNVDTLHDFEILPNEYYEITHSRYYFFTPPDNSPLGQFHKWYCKKCIKDISDLYDFKGNVGKSYCIQTLFHDDVLQRVEDRDNYCSNCFTTLLYTLHECTGDNYIDVANFWSVPYDRL